MGDIGIKVSLPGQDVKTAPDSQQLFNSGWPTLPIYKNIFVPAHDTQASSNGYFQVYHHGLGFVPAVLPYGNTGTGGYQASASINRQNIAFDNENIYLIPSKPGTGTTDMGLMIFNLDIEKPYQAPNVNAALSSSIGRSKDFGIKATKENADITSTDLRDFVIHSSTRSPLIHAVVPGQLPAAPLPANTTFSYSYNLPYNPMFFAYMQDPTLSAYTLVNGYAGLATQGNTISITGSLVNAGQPRVSIVLLKDPFYIDDNIINLSL